MRGNIATEIQASQRLRRARTELTALTGAGALPALHRPSPVPLSSLLTTATRTEAKSLPLAVKELTRKDQHRAKCRNDFSFAIGMTNGGFTPAK
jgi:hypothetical protein